MPTSTPTPTPTPTPGTATNTPEPSGTTIFYGDANVDGEITASDAAAILRHIVRLQQLTEQGLLNAEVDGDGAITASDAAQVLRYIVRIVDSLPV
ncbi:MAG: dockerin type I repeat-containing protein [Clostridia bacterium]|nr:dockerin type I repeat-containing protein [Clostridia bacterium]